MSKNKIRLYCDINLRELFEAEKECALAKEQFHYLIDVMRCKVGDKLNLLDGKTGEYECKITFISRKEIRIRILHFLKSLASPVDLWLLFAPIKKGKTELIIEKCVELGVKRIMPVLTDFTNVPKINRRRFKSIMISSAQQCGSTWLPDLEDLQDLTQVLSSWNSKRLLIFCDEKLDGNHINTVLHSLGSRPMAILIGPEGGFSRTESELLISSEFVRRVSLGPQILRAETAVIASVSIWQSICGFWPKTLS